MKKSSNSGPKFNIRISIIIVTLSIIPYSFAKEGMPFSKYIGIDSTYSNMRFKKYYGNNIFNNKAIPGVNIFIGHVFNKIWNIEAGYEVNKNMKRNNVMVYENYIVTANFIGPGLGWQCYNTYVKQHHVYLGMLGKHHFNKNIFGSLMVGISLSHIYAKFNIFDDGTPADINITRSFDKNNLIPIIKTAIEYKITDNFGLRALTTWKKTSKFKIKSKEQNSISKIELKNTINIGIGVTYYWN